MIKINLLNSSVATAIALSGSALAGDVIAEAAAPAPSNNGDWCAGFKTVGKFYKNEDDPYIQSLKFFGRFQYQYAHIDGEGVDGESFSEGIDEVRRFRFGSEIKFLNGFKLKGNINLVNDSAKSGGTREFEHKDWDELTLSYSKKDVAGFDKAGISYGRHKVAMGHESHTSSKKIKTVERSPLSNKIYDERWTGVKLKLEQGNWNGIIGYFSQDDKKERDAWGSMSQGSAFYLSSAWELNSGNLLFDFFHMSDDEDADPDMNDYNWAASLAYDTEIANWDLMVNVVYGDNGDASYDKSSTTEGNFYGLVVMPSTYLVDDKLEFVARYVYQASEGDEGIRANSRYFRTPDEIGEADMNGGRGDSYHSIYAGLNYYLCGNNSKVQVGAEYETLDAADGDANNTTLWAAYRMYF